MPDFLSDTTGPAPGVQGEEINVAAVDQSTEFGRRQQQWPRPHKGIQHQLPIVHQAQVGHKEGQQRVHRRVADKFARFNRESLDEMALTLADSWSEKHLERRRRQVVVVQAPELDEREGGGRLG